MTQYLSACADATLTTPAQREAIERSAAALTRRLQEHFGQGVCHQLPFGSNARGTNLPQALDEQSDVDHMVVFADSGKQPQAYLDRLRLFAQKYYPRSLVRQARPTIVLELDHIRFDLVPAIDTFFGGLQIPEGEGSWIATRPSDFERKLSSRDAACDGQLRRAIRLLKLWNCCNGRIFSSFGLEQAMVGRFYAECEQLTDYVLQIFDDLPRTSAQRDTVKAARSRMKAASIFMQHGLPDLADEQFAALFPIARLAWPGR